MPHANNGESSFGPLPPMQEQELIREHLFDVVNDAEAEKSGGGDSREKKY